MGKYAKLKEQLEKQGETLAEIQEQLSDKDKLKEVAEMEKEIAENKKVIEAAEKKLEVQKNDILGGSKDAKKLSDDERKAMRSKVSNLLKN